MNLFSQVALLVLQAVVRVLLELIEALAARLEHAPDAGALLVRERQFAIEPVEENPRGRTASAETGPGRALEVTKRTSGRSNHTTPEQDTGGEADAEHGENEKREPDARPVIEHRRTDP